MSFDFWDVIRRAGQAVLSVAEERRQSDQELLAKGSVTFILGAGVSCPYRLPAWQDLVTEVYLTSRGIDDSDKREVLFKPYKQQISGYFSGSVLRQARYVTSKIEKAQLLQSVKQSLYRSCASLNEYPTFDSLTAWCKSNKKKVNFVTYNYDDLLEQYLKKQGVDCVSIYNSAGFAAYDGSRIPVYHVHGYLPQSAEPDLDQELVLSEQQYNQLMTDPESTDWRNHIQRELFASSACLFLGISLDDPNTRRLLDQTPTVGKIFRTRPQNIRAGSYGMTELKEAISTGNFEKQIEILEAMAASAKGELFMDHVTKKFDVPEHEGFADLDEDLQKKLVDVIIDAPFSNNFVCDDEEFGLTTVLLEDWGKLPAQLDYLLGLC